MKQRVENQENRKRINVTVSSELYNKLKEQAELTGCSIPAVLVFYASEHIKQAEAIRNMPNMLSSVLQIANLKNDDSGEK